MNDSDKRFDELICQIEKLILVTVPAIKKSINILKNEEIIQGLYNYEEIKVKEEELELLRKEYTKLIKELLKLNSSKAKFLVDGFINKRKELDKNYVRDLKNANRGDNPSWMSVGNY